MTQPDKIDVDDETLGKRLKSLLFGDTKATDDGATEQSPEDADKYVAEAARTLKEGRPLNASNREALMAAHDAIESALSTDMSFDTNRFSDNDEYAFDVESFGKSFDGKQEADDVAEVERQEIMGTIGGILGGEADSALVDGMLAADAVEVNDEAQATGIIRNVLDARINMIEEAIFGDVAEDNDQENDQDMTDDNPEGDAPKWAETLIDKVEQIDKRVDEIEGDDEKSFDDAPDWARDVAEKVDELDDRVDKLSKTTADTEQATGDEKNGEANDEVEAFKNGLIPGGQ